MAIVETIPDVDAGPSRARQRRGKRGKRGAGAGGGGEVPLRQPSDAPAAAEGQKPLLDLTLDDLRAAGVTFSDEMPADVAAAAGMPPGVGGAGGELGEEDVYDSEEEVLDPEDDPDTPTDADRALEAWWDEVFDSMVYTIPFSFLFLLLDILSNNTYAVERSKMYYVKNYAFALPTIGVLVFYANRHMARSETCRLITTAVSIGASTRVIWLMNRASYLTVMTQGPAYGTIWICTIVLLPLGHALVALAAWYSFVWAKGLRINL